MGASNTYINGSLDVSETEERLRGIQENIFRFVFAHPKQFLEYDSTKQTTRVRYEKKLTQNYFSYLVIDEVHVIENFGLSFVKEYLALGKLRKQFCNPKVILLTATASKKTREFIIENLELKKDEVSEFVCGFYRPEINLQVYKTGYFDEDKKIFISRDVKLIYLLTNGPDGKSLIFATTTNQVDEIYKMLLGEGFKVTKYHSKLSDLEKETNFKSYIESRNDVMVATSAFGMGIDIPDIHQVIHYSLPFSITDYYQQFGRAGRDGASSVAQLIFDQQESTSLVDFINRKTIESEQNENDRNILRRIRDEEKVALLEYIDINDKWKYIKSYFGETDKPFSLNTVILYILITLVALYILCSLI